MALQRNLRIDLIASVDKNDAGCSMRTICALDSQVAV